ncbi:MAG: arginine decarboxylase, pyruvoyl-dependent [Firmicutes bacterium]|nr:arginine decarboxylase, pyruvoyl-dependent [Bacillota bacterium]
MLPTPKKFKIVSGSAEGKTLLNAFDNALLAAGIGNVNLLRVSSILPPEAQLDSGLFIPPGSLVPTAYGYVISENPGEKICAAVGIGFTADTFGVIMEYAGKGDRAFAEAQIRHMLENAFETRKLPLVEMKIAASEHAVDKTGCAFAAVPLWY